jgi:hypothetical protein
VVYVTGIDGEGQPSSGTGTLLIGDASLWGNYILTAAHVIAGGAKQVRFDMPLYGRFNDQALRAPDQVAIWVPVSLESGYGALHPEFDDNGWRSWDYDLAILKLVDPYNPAPDRLLVRPYGAQAYRTYPWNFVEDEIGRLVTFVGYGRSGVGATGDTIPVGYRKHLGYNLIEYDRWDSLNPVTACALGTPKALVFDFDDGTEAHDALGRKANTPNIGLGNLEAMTAPGDSGGPWFALDSAGNRYIVGVHSAADRFSGILVQPDIDGVVNSTFGEVAIATRVGRHIDFITANTTDDAYHLVLEMEGQTYGRSSPAEGVVDNLTITVRTTASGALFIDVSNGGPDGGLNGTYYTATASNIKSLTIRGTGDNETIIIEGPLGLGQDGHAPIYIEARGGNDSIQIVRPDGPTANDYLGTIFIDGSDGTDTLWVDNSFSQHAYTEHTIAAGDTGWTTGIYRRVGTSAATAVLRSTINLGNVEEYRLATGVGADVVRVNVTPIAPDFFGTFIFTNGGNDEVVVGSNVPAEGGTLSVRGRVFVDLGTGDTDKITFDDTNFPFANAWYTLSTSTAAGWNYALYRLLPPSQSLHSFHFNNADQINIHTGAGADTVQIVASPASPNTTDGTFVSTKGGNDRVFVGSTTVGLLNVAGKVFVDTGADVDNGPGTGDEITFQDGPSNGQAIGYTLSKLPAGDWDYRLLRYVGTSGFPPFEFKNAERVDLNTGAQDDTVNILATPAARNGVFVRTGGGNDTITVGGNNRGLDDILAVVNADGQGGRNSLILDNRLSASKAITLTRTRGVRGDGKTVDFARVQWLLVRTDGGAANVNVESKDAGVNIEVELQSGNNAVTTGAGQLAFQLGGEMDRLTVTCLPNDIGDQVTVAGTLAVTVLPTFTATVGQVVTLIDNQTALAVVGTFAGLPEGATVAVGGWRFTISYIGRTDPNDQYFNDVILTVASLPPGSGNTGSVAGTVWDDQNGNGLKDDGARAQGVGST